MVTYCVWFDVCFISTSYCSIIQKNHNKEPIRKQPEPHILDEAVIWKHYVCAADPWMNSLNRSGYSLNLPVFILWQREGGQMLECSCHNLATFEGQIMWRKTHLNANLCQEFALFSGGYTSWKLLEMLRRIVNSITTCLILYLMIVCGPLRTQVCYQE